MNEMIERAMRAVEDLPAGKLGSPIYGTDYEAIVCAVIAVMREPTEAMQVAGALERVGVAYTANGEGRCLTPNHVWRAMIDQILKDQ